MNKTCFRDFDAFAESVGDVDCVMTLQNPRFRIWTISQVSLPGVHVQHGQLGSGNIVEGRSHNNGYLLYLPLTDTCTYLVNGEVVDRGSFAVFEPGCEFCVSTQDQHDWCTVFVPSDALLGHKNVLARSSGPEKANCRVSEPNRLAADQFQALVHQVMAAAADSQQFESSPAAVGAAAKLIEVASVVVEPRKSLDTPQMGRPKASRKQIIRCANELLEARHNESISVQQLAAAAQVSERTLRSVFQDFFGVGPVAYLQLRQLRKVRNLLKKSDPKTTCVGDLLASNGIWEFGRFASRYRRLYGENPSETLRKPTRQA